MKTARFFATIFLAAAGTSLIAQQVNATSQQQSSASVSSAQHANDTKASDSSHADVSASDGPGGVHANGSAENSANVNTAQSAMGFGDQASSHAYEMSSVTGELQGKLDAKHAKVGDRVVLKTTEKVQTSDGTVIPRGTRLVGHVTQVQTRDSTHAVSQLAIAFDRAEMKNGQSLPVHTLIRGVNPSPSAMAMNSDSQMSAIDEPSGGGAMSGGRGGRGGGGLLAGGGNVAGGLVDKTSASTSSLAERAGGTVNGDMVGAVQVAGHGDVNENLGAHQFAAARAVPHATAIPGVMLAGDSSASGVFSASKKDIEFESGTQMQLGIVADR